MAEVADATALAHEAAIPVRLTLAASDLVSDHLPPPVMVSSLCSAGVLVCLLQDACLSRLKAFCTVQAMVSRAGYLAFAAEEARPLFQVRIWFEGFQVVFRPEGEM